MADIMVVVWEHLSSDSMLLCTTGVRVMVSVI
jgi:hypothetical protein